MFYANNEQVKGIFLNGRNYNYLVCGFGKVIPEDRSAEQLNLNLDYKYLNKYKIEFGTVKDGYENALVSPRFDKPDSNGIFHSPFTYYYNGNIISTKNVPVLITDGNRALRNALVYNDMNINGAINYFATNTDFQGHNVNVFPEKDNRPLLNYEMLNNCSNFDLSIETRFSKAAYPTLYNCNNFSGNFRYVGNQDYNYPGFRGFLYGCRDGVFNIDCTNMHGGGSDANVRNYFNFSGIQGCNNMNVNITGSSWQVWPHDHSCSSNCNINTYNVISGFGYMNYCNFNVELPKDSKPEMDKSFEFLNNAVNCNYNLNALDSKLFNYRSGVAFFDNLNNCNLNLLVNNTVCSDYSFGNNLSNCNIVFDNIKADLSTFVGWYKLYNCNITGNVNSTSLARSFLECCDSLNVNLNFAKSSRVVPTWGCNNVKGNIVAGGDTQLACSNYLNLNVSRGNLRLDWIEHSRFNFNGTNTYANNINNCKFEIYNCNGFAANKVSNSYIRVKNVSFSVRNTEYTEIQSEGTNDIITGVDNCHKLFLYGPNIVSGTIIERVYDSFLAFGSSFGKFRTFRVDNCSITGFPYSSSYTTNCRFDVSLKGAMAINSSYITWNNVWPHGFKTSGSYRYLAGLKSMDDSMSRCSMDSDDIALDGNKMFINVNNMQTSIDTYYNGTVTANLPVYNMRIKFNVDCSTLNLGIFQAAPPHGFQNATISANTIYAKGSMPDSYVQVNCDTKIYCENYCNVCFCPCNTDFNAVLQPVILVNNCDHYNSGTQSLFGGLTRIGSLSTRGPRSLYLAAGACVFINNAILSNVTVDNSLLFIGSKVQTYNLNVTNGGRIVNLSNWDSSALSFVERKSLAWNIWDSGPWGSQSLLNFCLNV